MTSSRRTRPNRGWAAPATRLPGETPSGGWSRQRLVMLLAGATIGAALLVAGLGYAAYLAVGGQQDQHAFPAPGTAPETGSSAAAGRAHRDAVATAPMLQVGPEAMRPTAPAATVAPRMAIPAATRMGTAGVPTGFPRTPAGAVGQLAAIETTVLTQMSIPVTDRVHAAWALPGAPDVAHWELTRDVQAFLGQTGQGPATDLATTVTAVPAGAMVKGTDGPDWTLACVLLKVRATITVQAQIGYGYCEPMQWAATPPSGNPPRRPRASTDTSTRPGTDSNTDAGRWMIAPGAAAAHAPSTWPGSPLSIRAGWRTWTGPGWPGPGWTGPEQ